MIRLRLGCLKHIACATLSLGLILVALEIALRWSDSQSGHITGENRGSPQLLTKCWLAHHRMKPLQTVSTQQPDSGEPVSFSTNSIGLRGPEIVVPKPPGVFRIVCLGDETTLASEVNESQTFCQALQRHLQKNTPTQVEVVNAGVPGYCPLLSFLFFKHALMSLQPDIVVMNFDMTDVADDYGYRRHTQMDDAANPLACRHPDLNSGKSRKKRRRDRFLLMTWGRKKLGGISTEREDQKDTLQIDSPRGRYAWLKDRPPDWSVYINQALEPLENLDALTSKLGATLVVAACPAPWQVSATASNSDEVRSAAGVAKSEFYRSAAPFLRLERFANDHRIRFCNPLSAFRGAKLPERLYLQNAPRYSRFGHELHARELSRSILPLLPRQPHSARTPERTAERRNGP